MPTNYEQQIADYRKMQREKIAAEKARQEAKAAQVKAEKTREKAGKLKGEVEEIQSSLAELLSLVPEIKPDDYLKKRDFLLDLINKQKIDNCCDKAVEKFEAIKKQYEQDESKDLLSNFDQVSQGIRQLKETVDNWFGSALEIYQDQNVSLAHMSVCYDAIRGCVVEKIDELNTPIEKIKSHFNLIANPALLKLLEQKLTDLQPKPDGLSKVGPELKPATQNSSYSCVAKILKVAGFIFIGAAAVIGTVLAIKLTFGLALSLFGIAAKTQAFVGAGLVAGGLFSLAASAALTNRQPGGGYETVPSR